MSTSYIVIRLKCSKNDPFAVGTRVCIGATNQSVCPVTALLGYLVVCPKRSLVHLPRWVYTIAREACLFPLPSFVRCGCEHGAVHFVSVL